MPIRILLRQMSYGFTDLHPLFLPFFVRSDHTAREGQVHRCATNSAPLRPQLPSALPSLRCPSTRPLWVRRPLPVEGDGGPSSMAHVGWRAVNGAACRRQTCRPCSARAGEQRLSFSSSPVLPPSSSRSCRNLKQRHLSMIALGGTIVRFSSYLARSLGGGRTRGARAPPLLPAPLLSNRSRPHKD